MIMEKQVRVQVIGGLKRNVVAGQFEDPDDDVMPKRMRRATVKDDDVTIAVTQQSPVPPPMPSPPLASSPISVSAALAPAIAAAITGIAKPQLPVPSIPHPGMIPVMMPMPVTWVPVPMMPHPTHPAPVAWQQHTFAMMNPIMQHIRQQLQSTTTAPFPPTLDHGRIPHQQQSQQHQHLPPQPSTTGSIQSASNLPVEVEKEWRIPCSHNYYPTPGFFRDPAATDATATTATTTMKSKPKSHTCSKGAKVIVTSTDDSFLEECDFPRIKEDTEKQFGLKAREINAVDVLCGRGGVTNYHEGNVQFRNLANQYRWHYATATKSRKARVARFLVQKIRDQQGRFLKKEADDSWYEIGDELALIKAAQTLREGLTKNYREELKAQMEIDRTVGSSTSYQPMRRLPSHQRKAKASHQHD
jgi:hypothetical protein